MAYNEHNGELSNLWNQIRFESMIKAEIREKITVNLRDFELNTWMMSCSVH